MLLDVFSVLYDLPPNLHCYFFEKPLSTSSLAITTKMSYYELYPQAVHGVWQTTATTIYDMASHVTVALIVGTLPLQEYFNV